MKVKLILEDDNRYDDLDSTSSIPKGKKRKIIMLRKNKAKKRKEKKRKEKKRKEKIFTWC